MLNVLNWVTRIDNRQLKKDSKKTQSILSGMGKKISGMFGPAAVGAAIAAGAVIALKKLVEVNLQFEKSQSSLQSILGATTEEMKFFRENSVRLGSTTTQTASQVSDAFKLIGSQKPELLKSQDALLSVTEQAIILSEAAGIDVPTAAKALTVSLNQMSESASSASDFVNILAAGSKAGGADIPFLNEAIVKSGAVARDANLSFEQLVAAIETIEPSMSDASSAGLQFKDILLRLQTEGKGFESGQFNLKDALVQVKSELDAIKDPVEKVAKETELFGKISLVAGKALLNNIDAYENFTTAVTGTNTALEQQSINTDNLQGSIDKFKSALEGAMLSLNNEGGLTGGLQDLVDIATKVIQNFDVVGDIFDFLLKPIKDLFVTLNGLGESLGLVTDEGDAVGAVMKILATTTKISMIPLTSLFKIVTLLLKGIKFLVDKIKSFVSSNKEMNKGLEIVRKVLAFVKEKFIELLAPLKQFIENIKLVGSSIVKSAIAQHMKNVSNAINFVVRNARALIAQFVEFIKTNRVTATALKLLKLHFENIKKIINALAAPIKLVVSQFNKLADNIREDQEPSLITGMTSAVQDLSAELYTAEERAKAFFDFIGMESNPFADRMEELQKQQAELQRSTTPDIEVEAEDIGLVITAEEIERLKIEAMADGIEKRIALAEFETRERIAVYQKAGLYTTEVAAQIEADRATEVQNIRDEYLQEELDRALQIESLKFQYLQEGINKRLAEIDLEYSEKLRQLDEFNLSEQEIMDLQTAILAEKQLAIDEANRQHQQTILDEERTELEQQIALRESEVLLVELTEKRKREIEIENQILRLQAQRDFDLNLTDLQKRTIDNQIEEQRRLLNETRNNNEFLQYSYETLGDSLESFGNKFIQIQKDETKSQEEKSKAIKKALFDEAQAVIVSAVIKYAASALGSLGFPLGLIAAPIAGLAAKGVFALLESGLNFEQGGIVPGTSYKGDKVPINANSKEMILNMGQQQKLFAIANGNINQPNNDLTNDLLKETNRLLKEKKELILYNNQLLESKNGVLTGGKTYL